MQNIQFVSASMTISLNDNLTNTKTMSHLGKKKKQKMYLSFCETARFCSDRCSEISLHFYLLAAL